MGAMFGYFVSGSIALPGMADHQGDWFSAVGVFAWLFEMGLIGLAGFALRDRVLRHARKSRPRRRRARVAAPALGLFGLLVLQPATALAHGGEEMTPEEMAAAEASKNSGSVDHTAMGHSTAHDPLLGGTELTIILLMGLGLLAWSGVALFSRICPAPRSAATHRPARPAPGRTSRRRPAALAMSSTESTPVPAARAPASPAAPAAAPLAPNPAELDPPSLPLHAEPPLRRRQPPPEVLPA